MLRKSIQRIAISAVALALIAISLFFPNSNGPTGIQWLTAMIKGRGTPHYPVAGTVESNFEAFLTRNPKARPQWREISNQENGLHQALELIRSTKLLDAKIVDPLLALHVAETFDSNTADEFLSQHAEWIIEIREIASKAQRTTDFLASSRTLSYADFATLDHILSDFPTNLEKAARNELSADYGWSDWMKGFQRAAILKAHTIAALQLHEIERTTGPVLDANDSRLRTLATEPFTGLSFHYDPTTRQLTSDPASSLRSEPDEIRIIQLSLTSTDF